MKGIENRKEINYVVISTDYDSYSLVGSPNQHSLFILSRTPRMRKSVYKMLLQEAKERGFDVSKLKIDLPIL